MRNIILALFFFSGSIFFGTTSLFGGLYGGGKVYTYYSLVFTVLIGCVTMITFIKKSNKRIPLTKIKIFLLYFSLLANVTYAYYRFDCSQPTRQLLLYFLGLTTPAVFIALCTDVESITKFYKIAGYLNIYLTVCVLIAFVNNAGSGMFSEFGGTTYLTIGYTMSALFAFNIIKLFNEKKRIKKVFYVLLSIFNILMIILSGSRGPLVCVAIMFLFYFIFIKRNMVLLFIPLLLIAIVSTISTNPNYNIAFLRMSLIFQEDYGIVSSGRGALYQLAITEFLKHPLLGNGIGAFTNNFEVYTYPHNIILEIVNDFGIVGLIIFVIIMVRLASKLMQMAKQGIQSQFVVLLFLNSIAGLMISGSYMENYQFWILSIIVMTFKTKNLQGELNYQHKGNNNCSEVIL